MKRKEKKNCEFLIEKEHFLCAISIERRLPNTYNYHALIDRLFFTKMRLIGSTCEKDQQQQQQQLDSQPRIQFTLIFDYNFVLIAIHLRFNNPNALKLDQRALGIENLKETTTTTEKKLSAKPKRTTFSKWLRNECTLMNVKNI